MMSSYAYNQLRDMARADSIRVERKHVLAVLDELDRAHARVEALEAWKRRSLVARRAAAKKRRAER